MVGILRWSKPLGAGLLAGLVAALAMTLVMLVLRSRLGISPPPEMVPDRIAPTLTVERFNELLRDYGGYNELKRFGIRAGLTGLFAVGALVGLAYPLVVERGRGATAAAGRSGVGRRGVLFLVAVAGVLWVGTLAFLWPNLDTNFRGLPPSRARLATGLGLLLSYATYGVVLAVAYAFLTGGRGRRPPATAEPAAAPGFGRRALVTGGLGLLLALLARNRLQRFERLATFSYDGKRINGLAIEPVTANADFYIVTKNVVDPNVSRRFWRLAVDGHVDRSRTYDFDDLGAMPATEQETTLRCISSAIGDGLISNAVWTGVPLPDLLAASAPQAGAVEVVLHGADGYTDTIAFEKAMQPTTLVVYRMNGEPVPERHGYPVRVIVPGLFGEKSVKWVTRIEVVDHEAKGFYENQGWGPSFVIPTRASVHAPDYHTPFPVGQPISFKGLAFGGDRGTSRVEVSLDGERSWDRAVIDYPGSGLSWALWHYDWTPPRTGEYPMVVRAADGTGQLQPAERRGVVPEGATGYHRVTVRVEA